MARPPEYDDGPRAESPGPVKIPDFMRRPDGSICPCKGPQDNQPMCPCQMKAKEQK